MSRHRNVKQLVDEDYYDDYDDDEYYDDDDYDEYDTYTGASAPVSANKATSKTKNATTGTAAGPSKKVSAGGAISPKQKQKPPPTTKLSTNTKQQQQQQPTKLKSNPLPPPPGFSVASPPRSAAGSALSKSPLSRTPTAPAAYLNISSVGPPPLPDILQPPATLADTKTTTKKTHLTVVVLGHVDAGKSTVTGHLLYGSSSTAKNGSSSNQRGRSNHNNPQSINYAWLLDEDEQERAHGVTMDIATKQLETKQFHIVLQDAPGHSDYVPAMITGTSAADAAMLTVDVTDLHTALHSGGGQLREHAFLAKGLGVQQILVVLNKMDLIGWDNREQYDALQAEMWQFLTQQVHYAETKIRFVPVSGLTGTNIFASDESAKDDDDTRMLRSWYKGPTLQEALDVFEPPVQQQSKLLEKPLRMVVAEVLDSSGTGVALRAKVVTGWAKQGESLVVLPVGDETVLTKLSSLHSTNKSTSALSSSSASDERRQYCVAGELIDCTVTGIDAQRISTGSVLARPQFRPPLADRCRAKIFVLDGMSSSTIPLIRGAQAIFHMHHLDIPCHLAVLVRTLKPDGTTILKERPRALTRNSTAIVELQLAVPICMEAFSDCRALARFVLRRSGDSIAVGRIEEVLIKK